MHLLFQGPFHIGVKKTIDFKLAWVLLCAGVVGSGIGVWIFSVLNNLGQLDLVISISYVTLLGFIGILMLVESIRTITRSRSGHTAGFRKPGQHNWIHGLPFKLRFKRSKIYISLIPVVILGWCIGFLGAVLGIGGGFIMVPALIYLLRVPTNIVVGTSLLQILVTMSAASIMHAITNQTVDGILALLLMVGGVIGAQFGARAGQVLRGEQLRALLALLVLAVGVRFAVDLILEPEDPFSFSVIGDSNMNFGEVR